MPLAFAISSGGLDVTKGDEWAYTRVALSWAETGDLKLVGWGEMMLVGHVAWGWLFVKLFGGTVGVLMVAGAAASGLALVAAGFLAARGATWRAYAAMSTIAAAPLFAGYSVSFMTDITALAGTLGCLALGAAGLGRTGRRRQLLIAASLLVGLAAFSVREVALAAPLAVLATLAIAPAVRIPLRTVVTLASCLLGAAALLYWWRHSLPGQQVISLGSDASHESAASRFGVAAPILRTYFTCALIASPALVLSVRSLPRDRWAVGAATTVLVAGLLVLARGQDDGLFLGDLFLSTLLPRSLWLVFNLGVLLVGAALAMWLRSATGSLRRWRDSSPQDFALAIFAIFALLAPVIRAAQAAPTFDRYLLPGAAVLTILVLRSTARPSRKELAGLCVAIALLAGVSGVLLAERNNRFVTEREVAEQWQARGYDARAITAIGLGWFGLPDQRSASAHREAPSSEEACLIITPEGGGWRGYELVESRPYRAFLTQRSINVYRRRGPCRA